MNKYRMHICFVFILTMLASSAQAGSRKRYRRNKNKQTAPQLYTHIDTNAFDNSTSADSASEPQQINPIKMPTAPVSESFSAIEPEVPSIAVAKVDAPIFEEH